MEFPKSKALLEHDAQKASCSGEAVAAVVMPQKIMKRDCKLCNYIQ